MGNLCLTREKAFIGDKLPGLRDFEGMTYEEGGTLLNTKPPTEVLTTIKKIGKGMFGEVWEAVDRRDGTKVAVKIIHITSEEHANLISLEVGTMLHCQGHPNITEVYGLYTDSAWSELCIFDGPRMWIVQQLIDPGDGPGSLFNLLTEKKENNRTTTTDDVMAVIRKCASGLSYMHSKGVIHRDIKPENIMLDGNNEIRIIDFGSAMFLPEGVDPVKHDALVGSWPYIAPECYRGEYGRATDVFGLACVGVELWLGKDKGPLELVMSSDGETPLLSERAVDIMEAEDEQERLEATANLVATMKQVLLKEARSRLDKKAAASTLVEKRKAKRGQAKKLSSLLQCMLDTCGSERPSMQDVYNDLEALS